MPALPPLPSLPLIQQTVAVADNGQLTLQPGRTARSPWARGGWLMLQPGVYAAEQISLGIGAYLQYDPNGQPDPGSGHDQEMAISPLQTVTIHVDDLDVARAAIISSGNSKTSTHLKVYVRAPSSQVYLGADSFFNGSLIAPTAHFVMMSGATMVGSAYARVIDVAENAQFTSHFPGEVEQEPLAPGVANMQPGTINPEDQMPPRAPGMDFELAQNTPNPCRLGSTFRFALPEDRDVDLRIFDVAGRAVKTLAAGRMSPGLHTMQWDGTSDKGQRLGSGVYFYRIVAGVDRAQKKLVVVD
jgi:hypothetical protein